MGRPSTWARRLRDRDLRRSARQRGRCSARGLRCSRDSRTPQVLDDELVASWGASLDLRVGIGTGEVLSETAHERPSVTGRPVQEALRLRQAAAAGEILLDERTHRLVVRGVDVDTSNTYPRLGDAAPRAPDREPRFGAPMVGRERERVGSSTRSSKRSTDRSCQLFTVLGAPGVGKSRLVHEFVATLRQSAVVAQGRCLPYGEGITYWPVLEAVRDVAELDDSAPLAENASKLAGLLDGDDEADASPSGSAEVVRSLGSSEQRRRELPGGARTSSRRWHAVSARAGLRRHPLGRGDVPRPREQSPTASAAFRRSSCAGSSGAARCASRVGRREAECDFRAPRAAFRDESASLVDNLIGARELDGSARHQIVEAAGGNPLFVEEMLALLLEVMGIASSSRCRRRSRRSLRPGSTACPIASARRSRRRPSKARSSTRPSRPADVGRSGGNARGLLALAREELVRTETPSSRGSARSASVTCSSAMLRTSRSPKEVRATASRASRRLARARAPEIEHSSLDEILGYHSSRRSSTGPSSARSTTRLGTSGRAAATRLGSAGRRALVRSDGPAGVNLISRSVALLPPDDPLRVELVPDVRVIQGLSDLSWADRVLTEAIEAAATSGDRALAAHALVQRGFLRLFTDEVSRRASSSTSRIGRSRSSRASATSSDSREPGGSPARLSTWTARRRVRGSIRARTGCMRAAPTIASRSARSSNGS